MFSWPVVPLPYVNRSAKITSESLGHNGFKRSRGVNNLVLRHRPQSCRRILLVTAIGSDTKPGLKVMRHRVTSESVCRARERLRKNASHDSHPAALEMLG